MATFKWYSAGPNASQGYVAGDAVVKGDYGQTLAHSLHVRRVNRDARVWEWKVCSFTVMDGGYIDRTTVAKGTIEFVEGDRGKAARKQAVDAAESACAAVLASEQQGKGK